jgi:hypothetical protein
MQLLAALLWTAILLSGQNDWPAYGHDAGNQRHSTLKAGGPRITLWWPSACLNLGRRVTL